ncbi:MAG: AraC family transcriptional regulator [Devosia sp.]
MTAHSRRGEGSGRPSPGAGRGEARTDPLPPAYEVEIATDDPLRLSAELARVFRPVAFRPVGNEGFRAEGSIAVLDGIRIMDLDFRSPFESVHERPFDGYLFTLPVPAAIIARRGERAEPISFTRGSAVDAAPIAGWTLPTPARLQTIAVECSRLVRFLAREVDRPIDRRPALLQRDLPAAIVPLLTALFCAIQAGMRGDAPLLSSGLALQQVEEALLGILMFNLAHDYGDAMRRARAPAATSWQVRRALDFMRANISRPISTADAAGAAGVGIRALQLAFKAQLGMSPTSYLRTLRLEHARADILGGSGTLEEIARRWGFASPRQFSLSYRMAFGELPSETAHRR